MSLQNCPKCKHESITWSIDEEVSLLTYWGCNNCGYGAEEDESCERLCSSCGAKSEMRFKDEDNEYWWCSNCNRITDINSQL